MHDYTKLLIDYLRVLGELKQAKYFVNDEIKRTIEVIEHELKISEGVK